MDLHEQQMGRLSNRGVFFLLLGITAFLMIVAFVSETTPPERWTLIAKFVSAILLVTLFSAICLRRSEFVTLRWNETTISLEHYLARKIETLNWTNIKQINITINGENVLNPLEALSKLEQIEMFKQQRNPAVRIIIYIEGNTESILLKSTMFQKSQMVTVLKLLQRQFRL
jgi:hypothetical protein